MNTTNAFVKILVLIIHHFLVLCQHGHRILHKCPERL